MNIPFLTKSESEPADNVGSAPAAPQPESSASMQSSAAALVAKHTRAKRSDAGKPRGPRKPEQVEGPVVDTTNIVNIELVKKSAAAIVGAIDGLVCRGIEGKARRIRLPEDMATEVVNSVMLTRSEQEIISESTALICQRHEFLMRHAPEFMLGSVLVVWSARIVTVTRKLDHWEKLLKEAAKKKENQASEPSAQHN